MQWAEAAWARARAAPPLPTPRRLQSGARECCSSAGQRVGPRADHLVRAVHAVARSSPGNRRASGRGARWEALARESARRLSELQPPALAALAWSLARVGGVPDALDAAIAACSQCVSQFGTKDLARVAWACAPSRRSNAEVAIEQIIEVITESSHMGPTDVCQLAWAVAKMALVQRSFMCDHISAAALRTLVQFDCRHLSALAWSYATLSLNDAEVFALIESRCIDLAHTFGPQELANVTWAFASVSQGSPSLSDALSLRSHNMIRLFSAQHLANLMWASAKATSRDENMFAALFHEAIDRVDELYPMHLAAVVWACAAFNGAEMRTCKRVGYYDAPLMEILRVTVLDRSCEFEPRGLANAVWGFAAMHLCEGLDRDLMITTAAALMSARACEFEGRDLAAIAWSAAELRTRSVPLTEAISQACLQKPGGLAGLSVQEAGSIAWCVGCSAPDTRSQIASGLHAVEQYATGHLAPALRRGLPAVAGGEPDRRGLAMLARGLVQLRLLKAFWGLLDALVDGELELGPDLGGVLLAGAERHSQSQRQARVWRALARGPWAPRALWPELQAAAASSSLAAAQDECGEPPLGMPRTKEFGQPTLAPSRRRKNAIHT
ncbi:unnamed protein product [Prorocentrum cordatum]|uniref:RNA-editing substrate-binding complex 6 protein domain-containing protein n=1 Tax=Prorocentrum cordatum TaxID=2364126 RepID=A0ABN9VB70_9DINO|nr:unnamed protein product [Polarella glacialis]